MVLDDSLFPSLQSEPRPWALSVQRLKQDPACYLNNIFAVTLPDEGCNDSAELASRGAVSHVLFPTSSPTRVTNKHLQWAESPKCTVDSATKLEPPVSRNPGVVISPA